MALPPMWNSPGRRGTFIKDTGRVVSSVRDVETKSTAVSDDLVHAWSLIILEVTLDEFGQRQEALRHLEHGKLKAVGNVEPELVGHFPTCINMR